MLKKTLIVAAFAAVVSAPAHALLLVNDWTLIDGSTTYSSLNAIKLSQDIPSVVSQQVDGSGNPYVGATFTESGNYYAATYITPVTLFTPFLDMSVSLSGAITGTSGPSLTYGVTSGSGSVSGSTSLFSLQLVTGTGSLNNNFILESNGSAQLLFLILDNAASEAALAGQADLLWALQHNGLFFNVTTDNVVTYASNDCTPTSESCTETIHITSEGAAKLYRIPEPGSLALLGLGLLGLVGTRRRMQ